MMLQRYQIKWHLNKEIIEIYTKKFCIKIFFNIYILKIFKLFRSVDFDDNVQAKTFAWGYVYILKISIKYLYLFFK